MSGERLHGHVHIEDKELLLYAGGELRARRKSQIIAHLEECPACQTRLENLDGAFSAFAEAHRQASTAELPPAQNARLRLEARLAELNAQERKTHTRAWPHSAWGLLLERRPQAFAIAMIALCSVLVLMRGLLARGPALSSQLGHWEEPNLRLTPGVTIPVTIDQVCGQAPAHAEPVVPVSLRQQVFQLYGVPTQSPDAYEVDYLITPELGGATDLRNLWPEPYGDTVWNARVKDQLENRLHQMVCRGDVDLATAQHDISADWIAAYRKYFHVDRPVSGRSSSNSSAPAIPFRALSFYIF